MKLKSIFAIAVFLAYSTANAGWIVASDSFQKGVIKISPQRGEVNVEVCPYLFAEKCQPLAELDNSDLLYMTTNQSKDVIFATIPHVLLLTIAQIVPLASTAGLALGTSATAISGQYILTKLKSVNILRQADYVNIFQDDFIQSDNKIISFPDDTLLDIISEF